ncbi:DUF2849 domain-containing protein [Tropicibacter naphthalenivorans]|uniref:DUF2849 domain-containing protein n=1 Tax=Tropicibacter naphthalenivorans TaxID=441103 RepID=A0A0P1GXG0_9RHOB|nr:DUF2849 domain-containing protein [Tropicibacter naphthalenivorans]CUH80395.1 hypothetical protein TRN7648_02966 [Tropicibacter naphthalenivorans]SMC86118.1 Protein of unknown function [Tropicibacter naphthalenivorans]
MPKAFTPKVITANALIEGDVVYLTADDRWSPRLTEAELLTDEAHAQVRLLDASNRHAEVVGVYLADMDATQDGPEPTHFREAFRRKGPSNYAHGKQADL